MIPVHPRPLLLATLSLLLPLAAIAQEPTKADKKLPLPGQSFLLEGREAFVILPKATTVDRPMPWVWYAPTLQGLPSQAEVWMFERLLAKGIAIAGIDVGESYGSPAGVALYDKLHAHLVKTRNFSPKPCLLARSRGGLMLYSWAASHPDKVAGIAGIYPVCNVESYPGLAKAAPAFGLDEAGLRSQLKKHNPVERLASLAKAKVPVRHIHGDSDKVVPLEANSGLLAERYRALGGPIELEVIESGGHDMKPHWFQSQPLVDFLVEHALGAVAPKK